MPLISDNKVAYIQIRYTSTTTTAQKFVIIMRLTNGDRQETSFLPIMFDQ